MYRIATAAMAAKAVVSGAIFGGYDTTNYEQNPVQIFDRYENHAAATASILVFSAKSADFYPATQEPKSLIKNLDSFVEKASTFPGFLVQYSREQNLALDGSLFQFEEVIRNEIKDPLVARGFRDLVPGYIQDPSLKDWTLNLVVLSKPEDTDTVNLILARVSLSIHSDKTQSAYIPKQDATIILTTFKVNSALLADNASSLAQRISIVSVHDFIAYFASPKVPFEDKQIQSGSTSCSQNRPLFKNRQTVMSWIL